MVFVTVHVAWEGFSLWNVRKGLVCGLVSRCVIEGCFCFLFAFQQRIMPYLTRADTANQELSGFLEFHTHGSVTMMIDTEFQEI